MILNINEQIKKVLDEIERTVSKGMIFSLEDFASYNLCKSSSNFKLFDVAIRIKVKTIAYIYSEKDKKYKKK